MRRKCERCGAELRADASFCPECGMEVQNEFKENCLEETNENVKVPKKKASVVKVILTVLVIVLLVGAGSCVAVKICNDLKAEERAEVLEEKGADENEEVEKENQEENNESTIASENSDSKESIEYVPITMDKIKNVTATSELSEYGMTHTAESVLDGNDSTAWVESADGQGIGESLTFEFDDTYRVSGIKIKNGF